MVRSRRWSTRVAPPAVREAAGVRRATLALLALALCGVVAAPPLGASVAPAPHSGARTEPARAQPAETPNDLGFGLQWGLRAIGAPAAWQKGLTGAGVRIAVIDSGADLGHEDLVAQVAAHVSCIGAAGNPAACSGGGGDDDGHGTHVAGIAAASTDNGAGVAGVAPEAELLVVRVLRHTCRQPLLGSPQCSASGSADDVIAGIRWAVQNGADVVNLSVGSSLQGVLGPAFAQAVREAWAAGAVPVVAAGNDTLLGSGFSGEPALVVAATAADGGAASYSTGVGQAQWGLAAPGGEPESDPAQCASGGNPEGILSTYVGNEYACLAGTSMAAPHVAGAVALLLGAGLTPQQAVDRLLGTATDLGSPGRDSTFGHGLVNLQTAVAGLEVPVRPPASDPTTTAASAPATSATAAPTTTATVPAGPTTAPPPAPAPSDPSFDPGQAVQLAPLPPAGGNEDLPALPVAVAVLMIAVSGCSTCWWAFRHASWARRTPV